MSFNTPVKNGGLSMSFFFKQKYICEKMKSTKMYDTFKQNIPNRLSRMHWLTKYKPQYRLIDMYLKWDYVSYIGQPTKFLKTVNIQQLNININMLPITKIKHGMVYTCIYTQIYQKSYFDIVCVVFCKINHLFLTMLHGQMKLCLMYHIC